MSARPRDEADGPEAQWERLVRTATAAYPGQGPDAPVGMPATTSYPGQGPDAGMPLAKAPAKARGILAFGEALLTFKSDPAAVVGGGATASACLRAVGGSELNVAVALAHLGLDVEWASVLPEGALGGEVIEVAKRAGVGVDAVYRRNGDIGTLHVLPGATAPIYQRSRSVFALHALDLCANWKELVDLKRWHYAWVVVSGITPLLGKQANEAWTACVRCAAANGSLVSLDLNHRPALGTLEQLMAEVHKVRDCLSLLSLSEANVRSLAASHAIRSPAPLDAAANPGQFEAVLAQLRCLLGVPLLACTIKRPLHQGTAAASDRRVPTRRWSVLVCGGEGAETVVVSTRRTPVEHSPREPLGGGDAWLAGFLSLVSGVASAKLPASPFWAGNPPLLELALRRGDLLAALHQYTHGDLSSVSKQELAAAEATWAGKTAALDPAEALAPSDASQELLDRLQRSWLLPIISVSDAADAVPLARALVAGGVLAAEVVLRNDAALEALSRIAKQVPELAIGAGTVLSLAQAAEAKRRGASFLVAPGLNAEVVRWAQANGLPIFPGVATATEIEQALGLGLTNLKFFPAEQLGGAKMLQALSAPYPQVRWLPTGGVGAASAETYLKLPCVLAVGGSWLAPAAAVEAADWDTVQCLAAAAVQAAAAARACGSSG